MSIHLLDWLMLKNRSVNNVVDIDINAHETEFDWIWWYLSFVLYGKHRICREGESVSNMFSALSATTYIGQRGKTLILEGADATGANQMFRFLLLIIYKYLKVADTQDTRCCFSQDAVKNFNSRFGRLKH